MSALRRRLVWLLLTAIGATALLGIAAVLGGGGETQGRTAGTTGAVTVAGLLALACVGALERKRARPVALVGLCASTVGLVSVVIGIWSEPDSDAFWKAWGTLALVAVWASLVCAQSRARLAPRFSWAFLASAALSGLLTLLGVVAIWGEESSGGFWRAFVALAIVVGAVVLAVPILHRASRDEITASEPDAVVKFCPACGSATADARSCAGCGARFDVRFLEN